MSKTTYVDILSGLEEAYYKNLQPGDRFVIPRVRKKIVFLSRSRKKGLTIRSLIPAIAEIWNNFSDAEREAWGEAGGEMGLNGYRLFVQDQSLRIKNDLSGVATPVLLHQSYVGVLQIDEPADELKITQLHPHFYWVSRKVYGSKGMYEPVKITEDLTLPVTIGLNYRAELEVVELCMAIYGSSEYAVSEFGSEDGPEEVISKFYARFWHSYQGRDIYTDLEIDLDLVTDWKSSEDTLTNLIGYVIGYNLNFHLKNLRGTLYCDNIKAEHSDQNWVRDPYCRDINQGFTRAFYQIPKHWTCVTCPDSTWFESFYIDW